MRLPASELLLRPGAEGIVLPMLATMGVTVRLKVLSDCRFRERRSTWIGLAGVSHISPALVTLPPRADEHDHRHVMYQATTSHPGQPHRLSCGELLAQAVRRCERRESGKRA